MALKLQNLPINVWVKYHSGMIAIDRTRDKVLDDMAESFYRASGCFSDDYKTDKIFTAAHIKPKTEKVLLKQRLNGDIRQIISGGKSAVVRELDYFVMKIA